MSFIADALKTPLHLFVAGLLAFPITLTVVARVSAQPAYNTVNHNPAVAPLAIAIARNDATRLIQSTGNLYWTTEIVNEFGPSIAIVYRASKSSTPGRERELYRETRTRPFNFGDITYAKVGGTWYGYFVANYPDLGVSRIKRVPLAGGTAVTLATSPRRVGLRDLKTDGLSLYWADAGGLRRMRIGGGAITTLVAGSTLESVGLDSTRVFYSDRQVIRSVPKTGGAITTRVIGSTTIRSMYVDRSAPNPVIYWGEANGAVKSRALGGNTTIHQAPIASPITSVSFDGARVLWTGCQPTHCSVRKRQGGTTTVVSSGGVGAGNVQGDATAMFWGDTAGVMKHVH